MRLVVLPAVAFFIGCYYPPPDSLALENSARHSISGNPSLFSSYANSIEYQDSIYLAAKEIKAAEIEMRSPNFSTIPRGGMIIATLKGVTLEMARSDNHLFVLQDESGKEVLREKGRPSVPNFTMQGSMTEWWDISVIYLSQPIHGTMTFYIINTLFKKRDSFLITATPHTLR